MDKRKQISYVNLPVEFLECVSQARSTHFSSFSLHFVAYRTHALVVNLCSKWKLFCSDLYVFMDASASKIDITWLIGLAGFMAPMHRYGMFI